MESELKSYCNIVIDMMKSNPPLVNEIKKIRLNDMTDYKFQKLSKEIMENIRESLIQQNILFQSLNKIFDPNNYDRCCRYLLELIKNTDDDALRDVNDLYATFENLNDTQDVYQLVNKGVSMLKELHVQYSNSVSGRNNERICQIHKMRVTSSKLLKMSLHQNQSLMNFEMQTNGLMEILDMCWLITEYPMRIVVKGTKNQKGRQFKVTISYIANQELNAPIVIEKKNVTIDAYMVSKEQYEEMQLSSYTEISDRYRISHSLPKISDSNYIIKDMIWKEDNISSSKTTDKRLSDETSVILFCVTCEYSVINLKKSILTPVKRKIWLHSDLTVVMVHSSPDEDVDAYITLFWEDFFGTINREISPKHLVEAICQYIEIESEHKLTKSNIDYLLNKIETLFHIQSDKYINFKTFKRSQLITQSNISFATWLFSIIHQLIKSPGIIEMWKSNLIVGFCSKDTDLFDELIDSNVFLLRFSDKSAKIGVVVRGDQFSKELDVWMPFDMKELKTMKLADILNTYKSLLSYIILAKDYPDSKTRIEHFETAVQPFVTTVHSLCEGYTQRGVVSPNRYDPIIYSNDCDLDSLLEHDLK